MEPKPVVIILVVVVFSIIILSISSLVAVLINRTSSAEKEQTEYEDEDDSVYVPEDDSVYVPEPQDDSSVPEPQDKQAPVQEELSWSQMTGWWPYGYDAGNSMPSSASLESVKEECAKRSNCKFITKRTPDKDWRLVRDFRVPRYAVGGVTYVNSRSELKDKDKPDKYLDDSLQWKQLPKGVVSWKNAKAHVQQYIKNHPLDADTLADICNAWGKNCKAVSETSPGNYVLFRELEYGPRDTSGKVKTFLNSRHPNFNGSFPYK